MSLLASITSFFHGEKRISSSEFEHAVNEVLLSDTVALENNIDKIKEDIQAIKAYLSVIQNGKANLTESHSPVTLTPLGQDIAKKMDIYTMISKNWTHIYEFISSKMSQENAYDIQQFCIDTATTSLEKFFLPEDLINIKSFAYKNGNPTAYYGSMIGVIIRDKYFETKGINISEVDNH